jgi:hypothetical protein
MGAVGIPKAVGFDPSVMVPLKVNREDVFVDNDTISTNKTKIRKRKLRRR